VSEKKEKEKSRKKDKEKKRRVPVSSLPPAKKVGKS
jgi:hypothetical protein